ncbi:hypothetical protein MRB53_035637 [Persea americana]|uniref:Uncharacterized protein n=1 Tax=Persea americana TaxID=3435 RepID=A0ACC2K574_PERAE|nr:hypothetical protein MRB53_035637 [Persea americana]
MIVSNKDDFRSEVDLLFECVGCVKAELVSFFLKWKRLEISSSLLSDGFTLHRTLGIHSLCEILKFKIYFLLEIISSISMQH